ncbi:MAG TPA: hypothetical protein VIC87_08095, partial [Vicinamibacteria bacterium]
MAERPRLLLGRRSARSFALTPIRSSGSRRGAGSADAFLEALAASGRLAVETAAAISSRSRRGPSSGDTVELELEDARGEAFVLAARHPSGAITLHRPHLVRSARTGTGESTSLLFSLPSGGAPSPGGRRGLAGAVLKVFVLKALGVLADALLPGLARTWETALWRRRGLTRGFVGVTPEA